MNTKTETFSKLEIDIFNFLNDLRNSGATNMFGATPYILDEFDIEKHDATKTLGKWMKNFNEDGYEHLEIEN